VFLVEFSLVVSFCALVVDDLKYELCCFLPYIGDHFVLSGDCVDLIAVVIGSYAPWDEYYWIRN
jgi:hypothetical protein